MIAVPYTRTLIHSLDFANNIGTFHFFSLPGNTSEIEGIVHSFSFMRNMNVYTVFHKAKRLMRLPYIHNVWAVIVCMNEKIELLCAL